MSRLDDPHAKLSGTGRYGGAPRRAFQAVACLLIVLVAWLAFKPSHGPDGGLSWDKANHALAFAVLTMVSARGWPGAGFWRLGAVMLLGGAVIEIIQGLPMIGRDMDGWDVVADMTGFALGWTATLARRRFDRRLVRV